MFKLKGFVMKILVLTLTVFGLMVVDGVCNGMHVLPAEPVAKKSASNGAVTGNSVLPPVAIEVQLDKNGNFDRILSYRFAEGGDLFLIKQPAAKGPEIKTFSLGNGLYLVGVGIVNTVTGVAVVVGVVVRGLSSVIGSTTKILVSKLWSAAPVAEAKQPAAAA
jgi:uncharacterized membrane protein